MESRPKRKKTGGRKKGIPNKTTQFVKDAILNEFDPKEFRAWKEKNPDAYYTQMVTRCLPKNIEGNLDGKIELIVQDCLADRTPK